MKPGKTELDQLCKIAIEAALKAGHTISENRDRKLDIKNKAGADSLAAQVVTEVDLLSQDIILKHILPTCKEFDLALLTEESADDKSRFEKDYFWCIDPMDGTLPFIKSSPGFSVSIALVSKSGEPLIGVVFDPVKKTLYHAIKGQGAFRNNEKWRPETGGRNKGITLVIDPGFSKHKWFNATLESFKSTYKKIQLIELGGAVMNACWVLENQPAVYFKFPKKEQGGGSLWDFAATACIFNETNAIVCDFFGNPLDLNRTDSSFMNHKGVIYASNPNLKEQIIGIYKQLR